MIELLLARLRRRIRAYVWADGLAAIAILLGASFWCSLAFDWLLEPPRVLRAVVLGCLGVVLVYVVYRLLLERLAVRLKNRNLALLLERRFGQFQDSLLTAVELADHPDHAADFNPDMLRHTVRDARARAAEVKLADIFNRAPLARRAVTAVAVAAASVAFVVAAPQAAGVWARRTILFSQELWPRQTRLLVEGFDEQGHLKLARGADWDLVVKADAASSRAVPEIVEVRYTTTDGTRGRETMSRDGVVTPGKDALQNYSHTFKSILAPLEFHVVGGDDRRGPYHLDVVDSPTITMTLHCEYPAYLQRSPRDLPVAGLMQIARGSQVTILAQANKPLVAAQIDDVADESTPVTHQLDVTVGGQPQMTFQFPLGRLDADKTLLFTLRDSDGIRGREAVRLAIAALPDEPPQVNVQLKGIGTAITPQAQLPAAGEVTDDYALARVWFEYHADQGPVRETPFQGTIAASEKLAVADVLDVRDLGLQPKQKFHLVVRAADHCALEQGPHVGVGQQYVLDVVAPEQLRSMLEARELMLRRRFETIVEELTATRDLLSGVRADGQRKPPAGAAESETGAAGDEASAERQAASRRASAAVQVERVLQNCQRSSHETLQVALAFDEIREEMVNNRVDTEELKARLKDGVADPLKHLVATRFSKLETQLKQLSGELADASRAAATQATAIAQIDAILVEMKGVLDKMLELETFNEVLDMLRQIIDAQDKINAETKQKQKQKLRDLTE